MLFMEPQELSRAGALPACFRAEVWSQEINEYQLSSLLAVA